MEPPCAVFFLLELTDLDLDLDLEEWLPAELDRDLSDCFNLCLLDL